MILFIVIYFAVIIIVTVSAYWGAKSGKLPRFFKKYPQISKILTFGYIIFAGCFVFPIRSNPFPLDFQKLYLLVLYYGVIALALAKIFGAGRGRMVYTATFLLTAIGMGCRYLLEFGEVSNTYNFTPFNIISYLVIVPAGTLTAYCWIVRRWRGR